MNNITHPDVARLTFKDVQTMKIPFTPLNSTLRDMINIYAAPHISPQLKKELLQQLEDISSNREDINNTFFYVFGASSYPLFLQMVAKEDTFACGGRIYTSLVDILYSDANPELLDICPVFTKGQKAFWDIEDTQYQKVFSSKSLHLVKVVTKKVSLGRHPKNTVDYCMFIPGGEILPRITEEIKNQKKIALGIL